MFVAVTEAQRVQRCISAIKLSFPLLPLLMFVFPLWQQQPHRHRHTHRHTHTHTHTHTRHFQHPAANRKVKMQIVLTVSLHVNLRCLLRPNFHLPALLTYRMKHSIYMSFSLLSNTLSLVTLRRHADTGRQLKKTGTWCFCKIKPNPGSYSVARASGPLRAGEWAATYASAYAWVCVDMEEKLCVCFCDAFKT